MNALRYFSKSVTEIARSLKASSLATLGASVIRHAAAVVLGNAITSRMLSVPVNSMVTRSRPNARPACGGAPNDRASSKKPQGHAHALNLKESGLDVVVGLYKGSKSWAKADLKVLMFSQLLKLLLKQMLLFFKVYTSPKVPSV